jgi:intracellular septation protein A
MATEGYSISVERWMTVVVALMSGLIGWVLLDHVSPVPRFMLVVVVVLYSLWIAHQEQSFSKTK